MIYRFYKEIDDYLIERWYIDLPEWEGLKAELEMVCGADTMLDIISEYGMEVHLNIDVNEFENSNMLEIIQNLNTKRQEDLEIVGGQYYILKTYEGREYNIEIWLCNVTKQIFNIFPDKIYFKKIENDLHLS